VACFEAPFTGLVWAPRDKTTAERTSRVLQWKRDNGERVSFRLPYGQTVDPENESRTIPDARELEVIAEIKKLRQQGLSYSAIARKLNEDGVPTKLGKVGGWQHATISRILRR